MILPVVNLQRHTELLLTAELRMNSFLVSLKARFLLLRNWFTCIDGKDSNDWATAIGKGPARTAALGD